MAKGRAVVRVVFDYEAQTNEELTVTEGILLCVIDDSDQDWLEVKSIQFEDAFSEQTSGLVPATYVEPAPYVAQYTGIYDYEARTEDELSFPEGGKLFVYDTNDPEWWLALFDREVGLVPANYLEITVYLLILIINSKRNLLQIKRNWVLTRWKVRWIKKKHFLVC
jgi:hypothetical protein